MTARTYAKIGALVLVVAALVVAARMLPFAEWLEVLNEWVRGLGPTGLLIYSAVYAVAAVLLLPGSLLTAAAGAVFGLLPGFATVLLGATAGAALAFLVSRHLARRRVESWIEAKPRFAAVDKAVAKEGWKIVFLTRLSPIFPFNFQNYAYGLTKISFWHYTLASLIGMIPGSFLYVYIGYLGRSSLEAAAGGDKVETLEMIFWIVGLAITVLVTVFITRIATKSLKEAGI